MEILENRSFDEERALYGSADLVLKNCAFDVLRTGRARLRKAKISNYITHSAICVILFGMIMA